MQGGLLMSKQESFLQLKSNTNKNISKKFKDTTLNNRTDKSFCISSKTDDDNHILFWDFDNIEKYYITRSLSQIQDYHELGDIFLVKSSHGYNAFCLDKFWLNEAYNILFYSRWNDFNHVRIGFKSESWCLRLSDDKKLDIQLIPTENYETREQSNAHYLFFKKFFKNDILRIINPDDTKLGEVQLESYKQNVI